jgi:hypothetical protein
MLIDPLKIRDFAVRYTTAWCSQNPSNVAELYSQDGSLTVNHDPAAVGRDAITEVARSFMIAFPDLCVTMDDLVLQNEQAEYHWTLTGTHTGPGGTGYKVRVSGLERWQLDASGLIASSKGHFDADEYLRQLGQGI